MRVASVLLALLPFSLAAQEHTTISGPVTVEIRSRDTSRVAEVTLEFRGRLFGSIGVLLPAPGQVHCGPTGCVATTPARLDLTDATGSARLTVPETGGELEVTVIPAAASGRRVIARGHTVSLSRTAAGPLDIRAASLTTRQ